MCDHPPRRSAAGWPAHLRPGALRWMRPSAHYADTVAYYRDVVGLPVLDTFAGSFGADGTILGLPDMGTQLEIVRADGSAGGSAGLDQLVFYLEDMDAVRTATAPLRARGLEPDPAPHPYWEANGALTYVDPDGRSVVFAPWVFGRVPAPVDRADTDAVVTAVRVTPYDGPREALRPLLELAEDSATQLDSYLPAGRMLVAVTGEAIVGHLQLVETDRSGEAELKSMAVREGFQRRGIGSRLVSAAVALLAAESVTTVLVATAAADTDNLRFYQRQGFRLRAVQRDAFGPDSGYAAGVVIDGIPLRDRVWLDRQLDP